MNKPLDYIDEAFHPYFQYREDHIELDQDLDQDTGQDNGPENDIYDVFIHLDENPHPYASHIMTYLYGNQQVEYDFILWQHPWSQSLVTRVLDRMATKADKLDLFNLAFFFLSKNPANWAVERLEAHPQYINWTGLSGNPNGRAVRLLQANRDKIDWQTIQENTNPDAFAMFQSMYIPSLNNNNNNNKKTDECFSSIQWNPRIGMNPAAFDVLHRYKADFIQSDIRKQFNHYLCLNRDDRVIEWYTQGSLFSNRIDWPSLCKNPCDAAVKLILSAHPDYTCPEAMLENPRKEVLQLVLDTYQRLGCWIDLSEASSVLGKNPAIFKGYDYHLFHSHHVIDSFSFLKERMKTTGLANELMANRFHPRYMDKWYSWGHEDEQDFI